MAQPREFFDFLPALTLAPADAARLLVEIKRLYPQLEAPLIAATRATPFYPGFALLGVQAQLGADEHLLWALAQPASGLIYLLDSQGGAIDRIDRIAPLALPDTAVAAHYLRLRLAFLHDHSQDRRFILLELAATDITIGADRASVEATLRVVCKSGDRPLREALARVRLKAGQGIVSARTENGWRAAGADAQAAAAAAPCSAVDVARVTAAPYFIDAWQHNWRPPAPAAQPSASAAAAIEEPYGSLLHNFSIDEEHRARTIIRSTRLPFYRTFQLFEVVVPGRSAVAEAGYCLGRPRPDGSGAWDFLILDGTSPPIHSANASKGAGELGEIMLGEHDPAPDQIGSWADRVAAYMRFFCWAVEGDGGPFFLPERLERLELAGFVPQDTRALIDATGLMPHMRCPPPAAIAPEHRAGGGFLRQALVFYDRVAFTAIFKVVPTGMIDMLEDNPLVETRLPIDVELMRAAGRRRWNEPAPALAEPLPDSGDGDPPVAEQPLPVSRVEDGIAIFEHHDFASAAAVVAALEGGRGSVFRHCRFQAGLNLRGRTLAGPLLFEHCTFERGSGAVAVDLTETQIDGALRFLDCHIRGHLHAPQARIGGAFAIAACVLVSGLPDAALRQIPQLRADTTGSFQGASSGLLQDSFSIDLAGIAVAGDLSIGAEWGGDARAGRTIVTGNILLQRASVERDLLLCGLWCRDTIDVTNARVTQNAIFGTDLDRTLSVAYFGNALSVCLDVRGIAAGGIEADALYFGHVRLGEEAVLITGWGQIDLGNADIAKNVAFFRVAVGGDLSFYAATVGGNIVFHETRINGSLSVVFAKIHLFFWAGSRGRGHLWDYHLHCRRSLDFSGASIGGIELSGARVEGDALFISGSCGCLYITPALVRRGKDVGLEVTHLRRLVMKNMVVDGDFRLHAVRVGSLPGNLFDYFARLFDRSGQAGIHIENSTVRGHLSTLPEEQTMAQQLRLNHEDMVKTDAGIRDFINDLEAQEGSGRLTATRMVIGDLLLRANHFMGSVELRDVAVFGRLVLADSEIDIDLHIDASRPVEQSTERDLNTRCIEADFEKIVCRGDANLTGLSVHKVLEVEDGSGTGFADLSSGSGGLTLRDADIKGDLQLVQWETASLARIEGKLDMSALIANKVVLTGENIQSKGGCVILERARLSRLQIIAPTPAPIDLTAIEVARWGFGRPDRPTTPGDPVQAAEYIEILRPMDPFDRGVWLAVESDLRNQGREPEANAVYRAMREQAHLYLSGWRKLRDRLSAVTLSYGTRPWLPLLPLLVAFVLLAGVFAQPGNVTAGADLIQAQGSDCAELYARGRAALPAAQQSALDTVPPLCERMTPALLGYSWTWVDGFYLALRHSVPVINVFSHDDWQAAHRPIQAPAWLPAAATAGGWWPAVRVDALASLVSLYAWIAVPISILFFSTKVFRGQRN